jgi:hypothetical protein
MRPSIALKRLAAVAAALGIALQGLWPLLAQARAGGPISVPICSSGGAHRTTELPLDGERSKQCAEHCKLFLLGGDRPALSNPFPVFLCSGQNAESVLPQAQEARKSSPRVSAPPRAPPVSL